VDDLASVESQTTAVGAMNIVFQDAATSILTNAYATISALVMIMRACMTVQDGLKATILAAVNLTRTKMTKKSAGQMIG